MSKLTQAIMPNHLWAFEQLLERYGRSRGQGDQHSQERFSPVLLGRQLRRGVLQGIICLDQNVACGMMLFKTGTQCIYVSLLYVVRRIDGEEILAALINHLRSHYRRQTILVGEPSSGLSVRKQNTIFSDHGFRTIKRYRMGCADGRQRSKIIRPAGIVFRKYHPGYHAQIADLDRLAYNAEPDRILVEVYADIGRGSPAIRMVSTGPKLFETRLSFLAFGGKQLVGAIYCINEGDDLVIANIATAPDFRRHGLASALLGKALLGMNRLGYRKAVLTVSRDNHPAMQLYKKFKFKLKRIEPCFVYQTGLGGGFPANHSGQKNRKPDRSPERFSV